MRMTESAAGLYWKNFIFKALTDYNSSSPTPATTAVS